MSTTESETRPPDPTNWAEVHDSAEFVELRSRLRRFVFPMTAIFLIWYLVYVLLADYAHGFMKTKLVGDFNVGLLLGLLQFVSTFVITSLYVRYADRKLDPLAARIRESVDITATPAGTQGAASNEEAAK
ncbi:DUF485 domain-containing protein [Actinokineospora inagensis]|uniref:DUF485 domain-containing protein n=1 Tax=Actinokineospora inagensis TaxID=103730 RepID=UPI00040D9013|nr:DUF485 domain-containing protein [Actinokineospora inagensis]